MKHFHLGWQALCPGADAGGAPGGDKSLVQLSQQRLDELIGRAFAKGARRAAQARQDAGPQPSQAQPQTARADQSQTARAQTDHPPAAQPLAERAAPNPADREPAAQAQTQAAQALPQTQAAQSQAQPVLTGMAQGPRPDPGSADGGAGPLAPEAFGGAADTGDSVHSAAPPAPGDADASVQLARARESLHLANQRLLQAMVAQQAPAAGLSARGAKAALQMVCFEDCAPNGLPDEAKVKDRLQSFAQSWPEFTAPPPPAPFAAGTGTAPLQQDVLKNALGVL